MDPVLCVDVGSTWTKAALVGGEGALLGTAQDPTSTPEVLDGVAAAAARLGADAAAALACSSAGGGLRLAVVGQEPLVSAEAGTRVALSAGARVVHVAAGELTAAGVRELRAAAPDVVLLVGGTDGGDDRCLLHNAARLAAARIRPPVVLAGNAAARDAALALLRGRTVVATGNVLPALGRLDPEPARAAIREVFLRHVIGGKGLSRGPRFRRMVRTVTPDAVLRGVELLAGVLADGGDVVVVDVGGATTDVYSVVGELEGPRAAAGAAPARRTVEGDLGLRSSATGVVAAARAERLAAPGLEDAAAARAERPGWVPDTDAERAAELRLAGLAAVLALRRHVRAGYGWGPHGPALLVLSGGVFRHAGAAACAAVADELRSDPALRPVLRRAATAVDERYVLAPAGLLAADGRAGAAAALLRGALGGAAAGSVAGAGPGRGPDRAGPVEDQQ